MNRIGIRHNTIVIFTLFIKSQNATEFENGKNGNICNKCILDTQRDTTQHNPTNNKTERNVCVLSII